MNHYQNTISQLKRHEGLRLKPYRCSEGYLTIGYGRNLETRGITEDEAEEMLLNDLSDVEQALDRHALLHGHNDARQAVMLNMGFQLGINGLLGFINFIEAYRRHEYELAAKEMLDSLWVKQTPSRAKELSEQMLTGEFQ